MSPPVRLGDLAAEFLARTWHHQGDPHMSDPVLGEARRVFARAYCRKFPQANQQQAYAAFDELPATERDWLLATAEKVLTAWPPRQPADSAADSDLRCGCTCRTPWSFEPGCRACDDAFPRLAGMEEVR